MLCLTSLKCQPNNIAGVVFLSPKHLLLNWRQFFRNTAKLGLQLWALVSTETIPTGIVPVGPHSLKE